MNSEAKKNFIIFLEKNPKLYGIAKSDMCLILLERLSAQGLPIEDLKKQNKFSQLSETDLETLLELLVTLKLLNKTKPIGKTVYFANGNTKLFLEIYNETKKGYNINNK